VLTGIHDSNASYFAQLAARDGDFAVVSSGTWVVVMSHGTRLAALDERRDTLANVDAFGDPVATARFMGGREYAAIAGAEGASHAIGEADVLATIERGDLVLPAFCAGVGPFPHAKGKLALASPHGPRERAAAAALYCALVTDVCLDLVGARGDVVVEGPFARNAGILSALAGLRPQQRVLVSSDATGTFAGAARLAAWSRGEQRAASPPSRRVQASPAPGAAFRAHRARWRRALG
jgi:sugar (pentulose or hexulose) kinase